MATSEYNYLKGFCQGRGLYNATKAFAFILEHHGDQTRHDGGPYYAHPVKVATHLISLGMFHDDLEKLDTLIAGALLHDVLEDTGVTIEMLSEQFSEEIALIVQYLTKTEGITNEVYYENVRKSLLASVIKISDRCNNVSTMAGVFSKSRLQRYIDETNSYIKPLIRYVRDYNPEISHQVVNMSYHIKSVLNAIEVMLPFMESKVES